MKLKEFMIRLNKEMLRLKSEGVLLDDVEVIINQSDRECSGGIDSIEGYHDIQLDDIPYDLNGMDIDGSEVINEHDDVIIINGSY